MLQYQISENLRDLKQDRFWNSLVVQWLRLHTLNVGGPGSIPGQGTRYHMPQLKILHTTTKTVQPNKNTPHTHTNERFILLAHTKFAEDLCDLPEGTAPLYQ